MLLVKTSNMTVFPRSWEMYILVSIEISCYLQNQIKIHNTHFIPFPVWLILLVFFLFPGDKEKSMEQEGEEEMKMVLNCPPIHPLPEEIKKKKVGSDSNIMSLKTPGRYLADFIFYLKLHLNARGTNTESFSQYRHVFTVGQYCTLPFKMTC